MSQTVKLDIPEFLNIGIACTSAWVGTAKENNVAMIIEDDKLEFPIGEAAYELVIAGSKKVNMYFVTIGAIFSSVVALFRDYSFKKGSAPLIPTLFSIKNTSLSFYVSPLLVGIGYILGFAEKAE